MVRELQSHIHAAKIDGMDAVLIEFGPGRFRQDLVWMLGRTITEADGRVWVFLAGRSGTALGPEALELGILASRSWVMPGVRFEWEGLAESEGMIPESVDRERLSRERYSDLWVALERRGANVRVADGLLRPTAPFRALRVMAGKTTLMDGPVDSAERGDVLTLVEPMADGGSKGSIGTDMALALGLVDGVLGSPREAIRAGLGDRVAGSIRTRRVTVENGLGRAVTEAHRLIGEARAESAKADNVLRRRLDSGLGQAAYERAVRERAAEALVSVERGEVSLRSLESLMRDHPEILRTRGPVQADLPGIEESSKAAWAREIEQIRRSLATTRSRATAQLTG
ncbi:MAG: hypothetical protein KIT54_01020 [Phycisphaeraceae bacterium]|nr:hypothetical protein [Phycisphaeraceae bacterium]